ncbi:hypothetical protein CUZ56_01211 [Saezia sanguinis]|uniref:Uncharacterized protein n=1 Tax=Saezia sanguinis TaxID=1965230 RepID=A0A433SEV2_9BURK|nr:hypothetical protein [Saezia sanguinis]RUS67268.1 hypothetical protein CUZ56_01211 [Saezia sanguinis]
MAKKHPSSINQFLLNQNYAILVDFRAQMATCLIATTPERLKRHADDYGWHLCSLKGARSTSALVIQKEDSDPELWVRVTYRCYRKAFRLFFHQFFDIDDIGNFGCFEVDHLHPQFGFNEHTSHYFIRLALVQKSINASYGAGFERVLYKREREKRLIGGVHMDWMTYLKVRGICVPMKSLSVTYWKTWAWQCAKELETDGFDTVLTYVGLITMLNDAFQNKFQPLPLDESFADEIQSYPSFPVVSQLSISH